MVEGICVPIVVPPRGKEDSFTLIMLDLASNPGGMSPIGISSTRLLCSARTSYSSPEVDLGEVPPPQLQPREDRRKSQPESRLILVSDGQGCHGLTSGKAEDGH